MPRPPPPATAFTIMAFPGASECTNAAAASKLAGPCDPATIGMPASFAAAIARTLSPNVRRTSGDGPTKVRPAFPQSRAKSALSLTKPYPG